MIEPHDVVFLVDVDNTLLDNDTVANDLRRHLLGSFGAEFEHRYWEIFEELRTELGYADYLGALQRFRVERPQDPQLFQISLFLIDYPFPDRLYPHTMEVIARFRRVGPVVVFSDGDAVFQPRKVSRSGLWHAVEGQVLIYIHKEEMLDDVARRYPAKHYVVVDDKLKILTAIKKIWGDRVTTVFPRQGHYATDLQVLAKYPAADISVDAIGDLRHRDVWP